MSMSNEKEESEYVPEFDSVDFSQFIFEKEARKMPGRSIEVGIINKNDETNTLQVALPKISIDELDITDGGVNGFFRTQLDLNDQSHIEFKNWLSNVDAWIVQNVIKNHKLWFGADWEEGGKYHGQPYIPANKIKDMFHPSIDDEEIFCARVHLRKEKYTLQIMDEEQNMISIDEINNCHVVPLIEIKGVFFKQTGYNLDCVLRGMVKISEDTETTDEREYVLFAVDDEEEDAEYYDYATEDGDSEVSMLEDVESQVLEEFKNLENATEDVDDEIEDDAQEEDTQEESDSFKIDDEKLKELMIAAENAKHAAENAQNAYRQYRNSADQSA